MDPAPVLAQTAGLERERARAEAVLANTPLRPSPLTVEDILDTLISLHDVPLLLAEADPEDRAELYRALGVSLAYRRSEAAVWIGRAIQPGGAGLPPVMRAVDSGSRSRNHGGAGIARSDYS
jgi:hypothetical protein